MNILKEGEYYELHNDDRYPLAYGRDLVGSKVFLEKLFLPISGSVPLAVVSAEDKVAYVFRQDMLRPIKANPHLIEQSQNMFYMLETIVKDAEGYESRGGKPVTWVKEAKEILSKARGGEL